MFWWQTFFRSHKPFMISRDLPPGSIGQSKLYT